MYLVAYRTKILKMSNSNILVGIVFFKEDGHYGH